MWYSGVVVVFFFKQKTAYEMRISDWSSDVCSSDLRPVKISGSAEGSTSLVTVFQVGRRSTRLTFIRSLSTETTPSVVLIRVGHSEQSVTVIAEIKIGRASCRERVCQYV